MSTLASYISLFLLNPCCGSDDNSLLELPTFNTATTTRSLITMAPTTRRSSKVAAPEAALPSDPLAAETMELVVEQRDSDVPPTPEKPTGVDTPMQMSSDSDIDIIALYRPQDEDSDDSDDPLSAAIDNEIRTREASTVPLEAIPEIEDVESGSEESDEDETPSAGAARQAKTARLAKAKAKKAEEEEKLLRERAEKEKQMQLEWQEKAEREEREKQERKKEFDRMERKEREDEEERPMQIERERGMKRMEEMRGGPIVVTMPVPPPRSMTATSPMPGSDLIPSLNVESVGSNNRTSATPTFNAARLAAPNINFSPRMHEPAEPAFPSVTYKCAGTTPIQGKVELYPCEAEVTIRIGRQIDQFGILKDAEAFRCHKCGCRMLYKMRTSRMVQFEAR